ncbi:unnamed protein product, partial [Rotaria magnacalcarata]
SKTPAGDNQQDEDDDDNNDLKNSTARSKRKDFDLPITARVPGLTKQELEQLIVQE